MKTNVNLFSRLLSVSRKRDVDVQNVLSRELCPVSLDLFYTYGAVRRTAESNLLNKDRNKKILATTFLGNPDLGATVTNFMAILYYNLLIKASSKDFQMKLMKFLQNSSKFSLLQSFIECEVLVVVPDQYDFEFSKTAAERKHQTEAQFIYRNLKLLITEKFQSHLKVTLGI